MGKVVERMLETGGAVVMLPPPRAEHHGASSKHLEKALREAAIC